MCEMKGPYVGGRGHKAEDRNRELYRFALAGASYERLATLTGLTKQRAWSAARAYAEDNGLPLPSDERLDVRKPTGAALFQKERAAARRRAEEVMPRA